MSDEATVERCWCGEPPESARHCGDHKPEHEQHVGVHFGGDGIRCPRGPHHFPCMCSPEKCDVCHVYAPAVHEPPDDEPHEIFVDADRVYGLRISSADPDELTFTWLDDNRAEGDLVPRWDMRREKVGELFNAIGRFLSDAEPGLAIEIEPRERMAIFGEIHVERGNQDAQWGGADHDDEHTWQDWLRYIQHQVAEVHLRPRRDESRGRFVKIAALAVAAIESFDRTTTRKDSAEVR